MKRRHDFLLSQSDNFLVRDALIHRISQLYTQVAAQNKSGAETKEKTIRILEALIDRYESLLKTVDRK